MALPVIGIIDSINYGKIKAKIKAHNMRTRSYSTNNLPIRIVEY